MVGLTRTASSSDETRPVPGEAKCLLLANSAASISRHSGGNSLYPPFLRSCSSLSAGAHEFLFPIVVSLSDSTQHAHLVRGRGGSRPPHAGCISPGEFALSWPEAAASHVHLQTLPEPPAVLALRVVRAVQVVFLELMLSRSQSSLVNAPKRFASACHDRHRYRKSASGPNGAFIVVCSVRHVHAPTQL